MRVVFDTNVLLSALATRGVCGDLLDATVKSTPHVLVLSEPILAEFARHFQDKFDMSADETSEAITFLRSHSVMVKPSDVPRDSSRDPDDVMVLGTALAGEAGLLVTGDNDLLVLHEFRGVAIVKPRAAYDLLCQL